MSIHNLIKKKNRLLLYKVTPMRNIPFKDIFIVNKKSNSHPNLNPIIINFLEDMEEFNSNPDNSILELACLFKKNIDKNFDKKAWEDYFFCN